MASWLKSAEELLHAVDKTAKAVHSVAKQQGPAGAVQNIVPTLAPGQRSQSSNPESDAEELPVSQPPAPEQQRQRQRPAVQPKPKPASNAAQEAINAAIKAAEEKSKQAETSSSTASLVKSVVSVVAPPAAARQVVAAAPSTASQETKPKPVIKQQPIAATKPQAQPSAAAVVEDADVSTAAVEPLTTTTDTANDETTTTTSTNDNNNPALNGERELRMRRALEAMKKKVARLEEENHQLEDLLSHADKQAKGGSGEISRLEDALAKEQAAKISAEAALASTIATKDAEIQALTVQVQSARIDAAAAIERVEALESSQHAITEERKVSESALISAVRSEVEAVEAQLQEERAAHAATRRASAAREQQLDASLVEVGDSLASMQRVLEEKSAKLTKLEEKCGVLEVDNDVLTARLKQTEAQLKQESSNNPDANKGNDEVEANKRIIEELEATLAAAKTRIGDLEAAAISTSTEVAQLKETNLELSKQVAHSNSLDVQDLQRRLQEVSDALYLKQTQLERVSADQAATRMALERQLTAAKAEAQQHRRRQSATDRALVAAEDGVVPTEIVLGDEYRERLANAGRVGGAVMAGVKLLDDSASQSMRVLRRYPLARLLVLVYVLFIHAFCYTLLHKLQHLSFHNIELAAAAAAGTDDLHHI